jgi:hypothetical protein
MNKRQTKKQAKELGTVLEALATQLPGIARGFELVAQQSVSTAEAIHRLRIEPYPPQERLLRMSLNGPLIPL